jgi:signal transduction histidine kinase
MFGLTKRVNEYLHLEVNFLKMLKRANMLSEEEIEKLNKLEEEAFNKDDFILTDINNLVVGCLQLGCQTGQNKKLGKGEEKLNLSLNIDVAPAVGEVTVHEENLRRILINLVDNAFYTVYEKKQRLGEDYRPTISVKTEKLDNESVTITVEDNGEGIEIGFWEAMKPLVTTKPKEEGTGLGLSIVEKLCEESKIKLSAKTDPGVFTRFILTLEPVIV